MRIVFVSNFFNHHQAPLADCLYSLCNGDYVFIETTEVPESRKKVGFPIIERPYLLKEWKSYEERERALELCLDADVLVCSSELMTLHYKKERLRKRKITFEYSERPLKRGFLNFFSKTNLVNQFYYHTLFYNKPFFKLCAGAYVANDQYAMHSFIGKCYKFGYFLQTKEIDIDKHLKRNIIKTKILWCSRFIELKHPEMVIKLAKRLRDVGADVEINMIGDGPMFSKIDELLKREELNSIVHLMGSLPNELVLKEMSEHHIFLFTSNKIEGWGAVINEAMANGCCVVSSDAVGSVPFLIKDGLNGRLFKSCDNDSLFDCVRDLIEHPYKQINMVREAYHTITHIWSPNNAALNFLQLCDDLVNGRKCSVNDGPCSLAHPVSNY